MCERLLPIATCASKCRNKIQKDALEQAFVNRLKSYFLSPEQIAANLSGALLLRCTDWTVGCVIFAARIRCNRFLWRSRWSIAVWQSIIEAGEQLLDSQGMRWSEAFD
jgi:hypothetical protein